MRSLVSGTVFKCVCVCIFLKKRGKGGKVGEVYFHVVHGRKFGTSLGQGVIPLERCEK